MAKRKLEGLYRPGYCPRLLSSCRSLNQIIADKHGSFICCGERDVPEDDLTPQDKYTFCFKNDMIDDMQHYDKRDIVHTSAVLLGALAHIEEWDSSQYHVGRPSLSSGE